MCFCQTQGSEDTYLRHFYNLKQLYLSPPILNVSLNAGLYSFIAIKIFLILNVMVLLSNNSRGIDVGTVAYAPVAQPYLNNTYSSYADTLLCRAGFHSKV